MHLHSRHITNDFEDQTSRHRDEEAPCSFGDSKGGLQDDGNSKEGEVEAIACQRWYIKNMSQLDRAGLKGA